jgi:hypothetical protein
MRNDNKTSSDSNVLMRRARRAAITSSGKTIPTTLKSFRRISMKARNVFTAWLSGSALLLCAGVNAETVNYTGTIHTLPTRLVMPLANGSSVVNASAHGYAAMYANSEAPILMEVTCTGMGLLEPDAEMVTDLEVYCRMDDDDDGFDLHGIDGPDGLEATIIGGSGRWAGATGSGSFRRTEVSETSSEATFNLEIKNP